MAENVDDKLIGGVSLLSGYVNKVRKGNRYFLSGNPGGISVQSSEFRSSGLWKIDR